MQVRDLVAVAVGTLVLAVPGLAHAHPGHDEGLGIFHGLGHPFSADFLLAALAVSLVLLTVGVIVWQAARRLGMRLVRTPGSLLPRLRW
jgi:hypothetical protein